MIPRAIGILKKHYKLNYKAADFYSDCLKREKRIFLKSMFSRLRAQKLAFNKKIQEHLLRYGRLDLDQERVTLLKEWKSPMGMSVNNYSNENLNEYCFRIEKASYEMIQESLRKINNGEIRDTLLQHRHQIRQAMEEMDTMKKYAI